MAERDDQQKHTASKLIHAAIDRIEDNEMAVLLVSDDKKTQVDMPLCLLPDGATDGDHLCINISIDKEARDAAASRVKKLQDKLTQASGTQDQKDFKL